MERVMALIVLLVVCVSATIPAPKHPHIATGDRHVVLEGARSHVWLYHERGAMVMWNHLGIHEGNCQETSGEAGDGDDGSEMATEGDGEDGGEASDEESTNPPPQGGNPPPEGGHSTPEGGNSTPEGGSEEECEQRRAKITDPITWYVDKIVEMTQNDSMVAEHIIVGNEHSLTFDIDETPASVSTIPGSQVQAVTGRMVLTSDLGFTLRIVVHIPQENGTITEGDETRSIYVGVVKFTIEIDNYPFEADTNKLVMTMKMRARCKAVQEQRETNARTPLRFNICNSANVVLSDKVILDGGIPTTLPEGAIHVLDPEQIGGKHEYDVLTLMFPHFSTSLVYDPETDTGSDEYNSNGDGAPECGGDICGAMAWTAGLLLTVLMALVSSVSNL